MKDDKTHKKQKKNQSASSTIQSEDKKGGKSKLQTHTDEPSRVENDGAQEP